ncbi:autophagy-related protein 13a-like [Mercurialis annua]|uniref:autophagy-related protein 13a-like n=1 Tax=Mercurialis annua TaxID=3986 RepID=UPI0021604C7C|nr:autophagy-related protein 13a-like [Mercurialis annua]
MDMESGKLEQIVCQFLLKSLHIVLESRVASHDRTSASSCRVRKSDKWFNLVLGHGLATLDSFNFWQTNPMEPMIIDIILVSHASAVETVIERWVVHYKTPHFTPSETNPSYKKTYKKSIILLRTLFSHTRLLPAFRIFRQLSSSTQTCNFDLIYKVSSFCDPFSRSDQDRMKEYSFVPVEAHPGHLSISLTYLPSLSHFNLQSLATFPPKIITDYVGSPRTDPEKGASFPLRGIRLPNSTPFQRPHSWTSGFHKPSPSVLNQRSPPASRTCQLPMDAFGRRVQVSDEFQLSPPFSPSMSPSAPTYIPNINPLRTCTTFETAPVTIPISVTGRSPRYVSPNFSDPTRNLLPPLSPRSTRCDPSSQESPSGIRFIKKVGTTRTAESNSGITNFYSGHKISKDSKDDSGRFSGLLSSSGSPRIGFSTSSSRLSFQDDLDDGDFSCPFDVDDVDMSDSLTSQNVDGKRNMDSSPHSLLIGKRSQDAAVGVLVHMLRTAPPLRQDSSCYSSSDLDVGVATDSGFFIPRKTADAMEELRSYREMKDLLLTKSGTRVVNKEA